MSESVVFNDLVLAGIFEQMEPATILSLCVRVCRQWHRVAHASRHVALHIVRVCARLEEQYRDKPQLSLTFVRQWSRELRVRTLCGALLRAEFDDADGCAWSGGGDEAAPINDVVRLLGHCILAAADARDDALLGSLGAQGSIKAISFFLRPRFWGPVDSESAVAVIGENAPLRASVWCIANIAALPAGRALLAKTDAPNLILDLLAISVARSAYKLATLCATALANLYCDASLRKAALGDLARVRGVLLPALAASVTTIEFQETQYQLCRVMRELVGKTDAALINASLDTIVQSNLLKQLVDTAFAHAPGEPVSLNMVGMLMTVLAEIGRSAVRPQLVADLLRPVLVQFMLMMSCTTLMHGFETVYPTSVVLAQLALLPGFVDGLSAHHIHAVGDAGSSLLYHLQNGRNRNPIIFDSTNLAALAIVHMIAAARDKSSLVVPRCDNSLPAEPEEHQLILAAANLLVGRCDAPMCKRKLREFAKCVSQRRVENGLTSLNLPQFVHQRATWMETSDVFGIGGALTFWANAFDAPENVARTHGWLIELHHQHQYPRSSKQIAAAAFGGRMLFKVAGLVTMRTQVRFATPEGLRELLMELINIGEEGYFAYPFAMGSMLDATVAQVMRSEFFKIKLRMHK
jgi:hypothetical protein